MFYFYDCLMEDFLIISCFSDMHQSFQQDLIRLRLLAARATVENLSVQSGLGNEKEKVKLSAQVILCLLSAFAQWGTCIFAFQYLIKTRSFIFFSLCNGYTK